MLAVNSRKAMFLCVEDFSGTEKTRIAIAEFLSKSTEEVGSHNAL